MAVGPGTRGRFAAVALAALAVAAPAHAAHRRAKVATALVGAINQVRAAHGLRPLRVSSQLAVAAAGHDREMGVKGYFAHAAADGSPVQARVPGSWSALGENLVWSTPGASAGQLVAAWMASPEHRANLLDPAWRRVGIGAATFASAPGVYRGQAVELVTADFGA